MSIYYCVGLGIVIIGDKCTLACNLFYSVFSKLLRIHSVSSIRVHQKLQRRVKKSSEK